MKLVFICGSLEFGRDGVGDYTRRLVGELIRQGHQAAAVALNDQYLTKEFIGTQTSEGINLPVLRMPSVWSASNRFNHAKEWINNFNPDWLSLQFVPFSFHPKGLPFGLSKLLANLGENRQWHIMFHELWVGMELQSSFKYQLWGILQRKIIQNLISNVKPKVIHTQTNIYQAQLCKLGVSCLYLPLFTNIPNISKLKNIAEEPFTNGKKVFSLVLFGFLSPGCPVHEFVKEIALYAKQNDINIKFTLIGRCGLEQENWVSACKSEKVPIELLGEQTAVQISKVLNNASIGISTTPIALAEKSGTLAAMRDHGLPIICVSKPWQARKIKDLESLPGVYEYKKGNLKYFLEEKPKYFSSYKVSEVSKILLKSLIIN